MSMEINWNDDEAVVRAAIGKLDVYGPSGDGCHIASNGGHIGYGNCLENMWKSARTHSSVVAWEKAHRPAPVEGVVLPHKTIPVLCVVDVDEGIASAVKFLNSILGVRTFASCQGTIGEGGASPYPAQVLVHCSEEILQSLTTYFKIGERIGGECCYIHPRHGVEIPTYDGFLSYDKNLAEAIAQRDAILEALREERSSKSALACRLVAAEAELVTARRDNAQLQYALEQSETAYTAARVQGREEGLREADEKINTPETEDFFKGVPLEAAHQRARWGSEHDSGKEPADWFWLIGYLAGKCLAAHIGGNRDKALHHTISTAAALANWHMAIKGAGSMRPGIEDPLALIPKK